MSDVQISHPILSDSLTAPLLTVQISHVVPCVMCANGVRRQNVARASGNSAHTAWRHPPRRSRRGVWAGRRRGAALTTFCLNTRLHAAALRRRACSLQLLTFDGRLLGGSLRVCTNFLNEKARAWRALLSYETQTLFKVEENPMATSPSDSRDWVN